MKFIFESCLLDTERRELSCGGNQVIVQPQVFDLLVHLIRNRNRVLGREELFREVLDRQFSPFDRSIDNHVSSLRKKLGPQAGGSDRIRAVRNAGYVYPMPEAHAQD